MFVLLKLFVRVAPVQLSLNAGLKPFPTNVNEQTPGSVFLTLFASGVNTGASLSVTVTVNEHVAVFPATSVTWNVFVVTPTGNDEPLGKPDVCVVLGPVQLSVPVGAV